MLKNYLKIALRSVRRHKGYAFINLVGLSVGLACCLLILLYVQDELAFDTVHPQAARTVRVVEARTTPEGAQHFADTMGPLGPALVQAFPEVERSVRLVGRDNTGRFAVSHGPNRFYSADHLFAEPAVFDVFAAEWVQGDPATALREPMTVVLTQSAARRYFGDEDPMGQTLTAERFGDFRVTGLLHDPPRNSHLQFSMLLSFATLESVEGWRRYMDRWDSGGFHTYLVLDDAAAAADVAALLPALLASADDAEELDARTLSLQPLTDVHFRSGHITFDRNAFKADPAYVYLFSAIAVFLLLIACINYMNLATARSMQRAHEVGLRKVVGAHRGQLIRQFMSESMLTALFALVLALVLVELLLPLFNQLADKTLDLDLAANAPFVLGLAVLALAVGVISGSYPALYLSRFRPVEVLRGIETGGGAARLRRGLVVTQFALSILMISATLVVYDQMQYVRNRPLGFDEEQLVVVDINDGGVRRDFATVKEEFARVPAVQAVSVSSNVPGDWKPITQVEVLPENAPDEERTTAFFLGVDEDFLDAFALTLADGRFFSDDFAADSLSVLLNETAARRLGLAVGDRLRVPGDQLFSRFAETTFTPRVAGIVEDFHFQSLHLPIAPMVLGYRTNPIDVIDYFTLRVDAAGVPATLDRLRAVGERFDPGHPFEYNMLDQRLQDFYVAERRAGRLFGIAAALAVLIACLGLFGLAAFTAERRTKEIGVRKVLGATVPGLVALLSKDFARLVALAFIVAAPVAYLVMTRWLDAFAYRVDLGPGVFLAAGAVALAIAFLTVGYQALRAALADPVKSLRYE